MGWGDEDTHGAIECPKCGAKYILKSKTLPSRDKDSASCRKCGAEVYDWNEARTYWLADIPDAK